MTTPAPTDDATSFRSDQVAAVPRAARRGKTGRPGEPAEINPVARVALMLDPPHLDHPFDYAVPAQLAEAAQPGVRVRVRFAGRLVDGILLSRVATSEHVGDLVPLKAVVGAGPVVTPEIMQLVRDVASRYAGTFADVVRSAVPPRHAAAEALTLSSSNAAADVPRGRGSPDSGSLGGRSISAEWQPYDGAAQFFADLAGPGVGPRAVWVAGPCEDPAKRVAELVAATMAAGSAQDGGAIVVVPDGRAVSAFAAALTQQGVVFESLTADRGPQARYSAFLRVLTGTRAVVLGTRAAVFAPVRRCRLLVIWDDLDDALAEPLSPGWHAREVAALRAATSGAALLIGGYGVSCESANLVQRGWARPLALPRAALREAAPNITVGGGASPRDPLADQVRLPSVAVAGVRDGLAKGHVLVSVPRAGYRPGLACATCRERACCLVCGSGLTQAPGQAAACPAHGVPAPGWRCPHCNGQQLRATVVGAVRTAEEFAAAFPGVNVLGSWGGARIPQLPRGHPALVVATPGCEPEPGPLGYASALILDAAATLSRPGLRAGEESLARWLTVAGMVRRGSEGGQVVIVGPSETREVQALLRWDPLGFAARELADRQALRLPPAARVAVLTGAANPTAELAQSVAARFRELEGDERRLQLAGPLPLPVASSHSPPVDGEATSRWVVTVPISAGANLARAVKEQQAWRSSHKLPVVSARLDPRSLS